MSRSPRTRAQTRAAQQARAAHQSWLVARDLDEMNGWLNEEAFTAILLAALLDPDSRDTMTTALLADTPAESLHAHGPLTLRSAPGSVMDLVLGFGEQPDLAAVVIEAKRFESPSNWCWSAQGEWLCQTDVAVEDSAEVEPPGWLWGVYQGQVHDFVLVDAFSRPAGTVFPGARHNHRWRTVGYADLGVTLRTAYDRGTRGLVPLLTALWADSSHRF